LHKLSWIRGGHGVVSLAQLGRIWLLFVGCVAASLISPNKLDGLIYPFTYLGDNASTRYVGEWFRTDFSQAQYWPFGLLLLITGFVLVIGTARRTSSLTELGLTIPFGYLGIQSMRNIAQFTVCAVPVAATGLTTILNKRRKTREHPLRPRRSGDVDQTHKALLTAACSTVVVLSLVFQTRADFTTSGNRAARELQFPTHATEWLVQHQGGHLFNYYDYGGWLVLHEVPVYVDGRPDMYGDSFMDNYVRVTGRAAAPQWAIEMQRLSVDRVLMPKDSPLANEMSAAIASGATTDWYEPITDPVARLFVKQDSDFHKF
jgi:hypothetical protein